MDSDTDVGKEEDDEEEEDKCFDWYKTGGQIKTLFAASIVTLTTVVGMWMLTVETLGAFFLLLCDNARKPVLFLQVYCTTCGIALTLLVIDISPLLSTSFFHALFAVFLLLFCTSGGLAGLLFIPSYSNQYPEDSRRLERVLHSGTSALFGTMASLVVVSVSSYRSLPYCVLVLGYLVLQANLPHGPRQVLQVDVLDPGVRNSVLTYMVSVTISSLLCWFDGWPNIVVEPLWLCCTALCACSFVMPVSNQGLGRYVWLVSGLVSLLTMPVLLAQHSVPKELLPWLCLGALLYSFVALQEKNKLSLYAAIGLLVFYTVLSWFLLPANLLSLVAFLVLNVMSVYALAKRYDHVLKGTLLLHAICFYLVKLWLPESHLTNFLLYPVIFAVYKLYLLNNLEASLASVILAVQLGSAISSQRALLPNIVFMALIFIALYIVLENPKPHQRPRLLAAVFILSLVNGFLEIRSLLQRYLETDIDFSFLAGISLGMTAAADFWLEDKTSSSNVAVLGRQLAVASLAFLLFRPPLTWEFVSLLTAAGLLFGFYKSSTWLSGRAKSSTCLTGRAQVYALFLTASVLLGLVATSVFENQLSVEVSSVRVQLLHISVYTSMCLIAVLLMSRIKDGLRQALLMILVLLCHLPVAYIFGETCTILFSLMSGFTAVVLRSYIYLNPNLRLSLLQQESERRGKLSLEHLVFLACNISTVCCVTALWSMEPHPWDSLHWKLASSSLLVLLHQDVLPRRYRVHSFVPMATVAVILILSHTFSQSSLWTGKRGLTFYCGLLEFIVSCATVPVWLKIFFLYHKPLREFKYLTHTIFLIFTPLSLYLPIVGSSWAAWELGVATLTCGIWVFQNSYDGESNMPLGLVT